MACRLLHLLLMPAAIVLTASSNLVAQAKYGQFAPDDAYEDGSELAYYGSENEWDRRFFEDRSATRLPQRRGQQIMLAILEDRMDFAFAMCDKWLAANPKDTEVLFALAVAQSKQGEVEKAWATCQRALAAGLPLARFLAGPRDLLNPLIESAEFQDYLAEHPVRLIHGPMLGSVTNNGASFWVRTAEPSEVAVRVFETANGDSPIQTTQAKTTEDSDYTTVLEVTGLDSNKQYFYDVLVDGESEWPSSRRTFATYPAPGIPGKFRIGFGGGAGFNPGFERIWDIIAEQELAAFLFLGDNVYIDLPQEPGDFHRYTYYRRQSRPELRRLVASTPIYAIWDDHDCATDDVWMGPYLDKPAWKPNMLKVFKENWNNPSYGDEDAPACWFSFSIGDVDFFMLDCRYYRENPFSERPSMLGEVQLAWLLGGLKSSRATFKVIASSVPFEPKSKPGSRDTWGGFLEERDDIFSFLAKEEIDGVVLIAADRHRSDAWRIEREEGYPLYEFMSSKLSNVHTHELMEGAIFGYNEQCSFGRVTFDTEKPNPTVTYDIVNIDGGVIDSLTVTKAELTGK